MIKVLIVEDSPVVQEFLTYVLSSDPGIQVSGVAKNGEEAIKAVRQKKFDVITMDIHMPVIDGYEATRQIMMTHPTPIVIVSGSNSATEVSSTFKAIEAGALAVISRPPGLDHENYDSATGELIQTVKLMSEVKVVKRIPDLARNRKAALLPFTQVYKTEDGIQIAAIGSSTGGPAALLQILSALPENLSFPILLVQHIAAGFIKGFAEWLNKSSHIPVRIAQQGEPLI